MRHIMPAAAAALVAASLSAATAAPADAVRAGDIGAMIEEIVTVYEDAGLSWDPAIEWTIGPFTTTYWFYDHITSRIAVGAVPMADEVDAYWQEWSTVLTDGSFEPSGFFASDEEALELARYNQFVLATHESAHAITFRYDHAHLRRHGYDVNCREYYADRLTVAILNEEARREADMARWRDRYHELVVAMGEAIPEQYRYNIPDFAALDADCALIEVAQPTPETMQPYASAYFERYRVLLEAELPPLGEVFETHLTAVHEASLGPVPYVPHRDQLELVTLGSADGVSLGRAYDFDDLGEAEVASRAAAFDAGGVLWFAILRYDRETQLAQFFFGINPETAEPTAPPGAWVRPSVNLEISSLAVLSPERFVFSLHSWDREGEGGEERFFVTIIDAEFGEDGWHFTTIGDVEGMRQAAVLRAPSGRLFMLATPDHTGPAPTQNWRGFEFSLESGEVVGDLPIGSGFGFPLAIDEEGRLYEELRHMLWGSTPEGNDAVVIGNGLVGPRDGVGARAELADIQVLQWMAEGRALIVDRGPGYRGWRLRELRPVQ